MAGLIAINVDVCNVLLCCQIQGQFTSNHKVA